MQVQVLADGADYESSVPYHRLVTELFLGARAAGGLPRRAASAGISSIVCATWSTFLRRSSDPTV